MRWAGTGNAMLRIVACMRCRIHSINPIYFPSAFRDVTRISPDLILACTCILTLLALQSCTKTSPPANRVILTIVDQSWVDKDSQRQLNEELAQFTKQSGIEVQVVPTSESAVEQLKTWRTLLERGAEVPDVYAIDVIWPAILADNLVDLRAYLPAQEISAHFPELIANDTVNGRLVALPYNMSEGLLFYRVDLLRKYGYRVPPKTWQELEAMAKRIQNGERATGNKDFWGYVWQGAPSEALTCNALEWQVAEGGGKIVDKDGKVTVNNPQTIRAWEMGARWVGSISPPGVIAYKEWDAFNIWQAGQAAFMRNWSGAYVAAKSQSSHTRDQFDIAPLPRGSAGIGAVLGGNSYAVSQHSLHKKEAVMLVRFLCGRDEQVRRSRSYAEPPTILELYNYPELLARNPYFSSVLEVFRNGVASRPSTSVGKMYPDVSRSYYEAVNRVLSRKRTAAQAAAELQDELVTMLKAPRTDANANRYQGSSNALR